MGKPKFIAVEESCLFGGGVKIRRNCRGDSFLRNKVSIATIEFFRIGSEIRLKLAFEGRAKKCGAFLVGGLYKSERKRAF